MKKTIYILFVLLMVGFNVHAQWSEQNSGSTATLTSVYSLDNSNVWVCGYTGVVLRTTNGGINWINCTGNGIPTNVSLINITGIPGVSTAALTAGYSGSNTWVWRTTNGGANWTQVFTEVGFINAICMFSATNGFMTGDPAGGRWSLWKTTNGGANWDSAGMYLPQVGAEAGWNNALCFASSKIWFGTNSTKIYYSSNSGSSWTGLPTTGELNSYAIWFHPQLMDGYGLFGGSTLWQTSNNGSNWSMLTSLGAGNFGGITSTPLPVDNLIQPAWYVRTSNIIYYSSNFGANWIAEYTNPASMQYRHISMAYPGRGLWAVGTVGKISYHTPLPTNIKNITTEVPYQFSLRQNYPNPFNSTTNIEFVVAGQSSHSVTLKVFDITGREVAALVNEVLNPGTYQVRFDAANLTSGVYFYTLTAGDYKQTKKLLLAR
jgi:photosystem II stability/assembly factor-like uncharacterized protein